MEKRKRKQLSEGAKVVLSDVRQDGAQNVAATLASNDIGLRQDVSLESDWERVVAKTMETFGRIDGLVNKTGLSLPDAIEATTGARTSRLARSCQASHELSSRVASKTQIEWIKLAMGVTQYGLLVQIPKAISQFELSRR